MEVYPRSLHLCQPQLRACACAKAARVASHSDVQVGGGNGPKTMEGESRNACDSPTDSCSLAESGMHGRIRVPALPYPDHPSCCDRFREFAAGVPVRVKLEGGGESAAANYCVNYLVHDANRCPEGVTAVRASRICGILARRCRMTDKTLANHELAGRKASRARAVLHLAQVRAGTARRDGGCPAASRVIRRP